MNSELTIFKHWVSLLGRLAESMDDQGNADPRLLKQCAKALEETLAANDDDRPASENEEGIPENSPVPVLIGQVKTIIRSLLVPEDK